MTPAQTEQARRFVAWAGWEWRVGMLAAPLTYRTTAGPHTMPARRCIGPSRWAVEGEGRNDIHNAADLLPDLADDLTKHAIEGLLRDRLEGAVHVWCEPNIYDGRDEWMCFARQRRRSAETRTMENRMLRVGPDWASALLAACEGAA